MNIVVAGGTGFLGSSIAAELAGAGHSVDVLSRNATPIRTSAGGELGARRADVTQPDSLLGTLDGADAVVAAVTFPNYPMEMPRKGLTFDRFDRGGTENLIAEAARAGVTHFFYISGAGADPSSARSWYRAKGWAEEAAITSGLRYAILRPSWAYGPGDRALGRLEMISRWSPVVPRIGVREQRIQPVYVKDIAHAVRLVFDDDDKWNETYEIGSADVLSMHEVITTMLEVTNRRRLVLPVPAPVMQVATLPLMLLPKPLLSPRGVAFAIQNGVVDISKLQSRLGFTPRPLRDGLKEYMG